MLTLYISAEEYISLRNLVEEPIKIDETFSATVAKKELGVIDNDYKLMMIFVTISLLKNFTEAIED